MDMTAINSGHKSIIEEGNSNLHNKAFLKNFIFVRVYNFRSPDLLKLR